jgi:hypothetical protein
MAKRHTAPAGTRNSQQLAALLIRLPEEGPKVFNNADSFSQAFDAAWKRQSSLPAAAAVNRQELLAQVMESLADHPFVQSAPERAQQVAVFRIRLLGL